MPAKKPTKTTTTKSSTTPAKTARKNHLIDQDYMFIILWLELKANRESIFGATKATKVGGNNKTCIAGLEKLAQALNKQSKGRLALTHRTAYGHLRTYRKKFRTAINMEVGTGFGVNEKDRAAGIYSVSAKLNKLCPYFERMKMLFGEDPSIRPAVTIDSTNDQELCSNHSSEDSYSEFELSEQIDCPSDQDDQDEISVSKSNSGQVSVSQSMETSPALTLNFDFNDETEAQQDEPRRDKLQQYDLQQDDLQQDDLQQDDQDPDNQDNQHQQPKTKKQRTKKPTLKDQRRVPPSLTDAPKDDRKHSFATIFQNSAAEKTATLALIEANRLAFEKEKWETEKLALAVPSTQIELDRIQLEREKLQDRVVERLLAVESKKKEARTSLVLAMVSQGKNADEIKTMMSLLD
jgi:hypothetical protein